MKLKAGIYTGHLEQPTNCNNGRLLFIVDDAEDEADKGKAIPFYPRPVNNNTLHVEPLE